MLDALEQAIHARGRSDDLIHHRERDTQYLSIRYSERLAEAGITASVGSVGDSYDNALAETVNGLYKPEVIRKRGPWRNVDEVEYATLEWVDWFNNRRLLEPIGDIPAAEYEAMYYQERGRRWPPESRQKPSGEPGAIHPAAGSRRISQSPREPWGAPGHSRRLPESVKWVPAAPRARGPKRVTPQKVRALAAPQRG